MSVEFPPWRLAGDDGEFPPWKLAETDAYHNTVRRRAVRGYGWSPDHPDPRDAEFMYAPPSAATPDHVDLSSLCPPVYDQGPLGSCTGNALAAAVQFGRMRQGLQEPGRTPSRLFIYFGERVIAGNAGNDAGGSLRDGIKVVKRDGVCFEQGADAWPYAVWRFSDRPPQACYDVAARNEVTSYHRLEQDVRHMEACLAEGFPFVFGFVAFPDLEDPLVRESGVLPMPSPGEDDPIGGHAVMAVGYDRAAARLKVRNSWGPRWGQGGYFWMPYDYVDPGRRLASDFWTIRLVDGSGA